MSGTTFNNSEKVYIGREAFSQNLTDLVLNKEASGEPVTEGRHPRIFPSYTVSEELLALGNAEDYLRVASNLSTVVEILLGGTL
jgi:hypothetical protein